MHFGVKTKMKMYYHMPQFYVKLVIYIVLEKYENSTFCLKYMLRSIVIGKISFDLGLTDPKTSVKIGF